MGYLFLDFETTGLNYKDNQITEVAIMSQFSPDPIYETFVQLEPGVFLPKEIIDITGITLADLNGGIPLADAKKQIENILKGNIVVCHNASFDLGFIHDIEIPDFYCTRTMVRMLLPNHKSYRLKDICMDLGMENFQWHRASSDARATKWLFMYLLSRFGEATIEVFKDKMLQMEDRPIKFIPKHGVVVR